MPLPRTTIVRPEWVAAQNLADWLTEPEITLFESWRSEKRRSEWLAGRLAAKSLVKDTFGLAPLTFDIGREGVAPCIINAFLPAITLSLSHSAGLGAATLSNQIVDGTVGIDVQQIRSVHPRLCSRVFTPKERDQITGRFGREDDTAGLLLLWALKEAAIKARRSAWGRSLQEIKVRLMKDGSVAIIEMTDEAPMAATYEYLEGWWVARAIRPPR